MRISTVLTSPEKRAFGFELKKLVDNACAAQPGLKAKLAKHLGWHNLSRLSKYADGTYFPSPALIKKIANGIGADWIPLLAHAGYFRELIDILFETSLYDDVSERRSCEASESRAPMNPKWRAARYAVFLFPLPGDARGLGYLYGRTPIEQSLQSDAPKARKELDHRHRLPPLLEHAKSTFDVGLKRDKALQFAGECVREWARIVSSEATANAERLISGRRLDPLPLDPLPADESNDVNLRASEYARALQNTKTQKELSR